MLESKHWYWLHQTRRCDVILERKKKRNFAVKAQVKCVEKKNRCENKAVLIHTSVIIVIENKCAVYVKSDAVGFYLGLCTPFTRNPY